MSIGLINVEGGLGKNVMLTSILKELKEKKGWDELYVISPYFDVFKACSIVDDAFAPGPGSASLYQDTVLMNDCEVLWKEPYSNQRFIKKQCHLFEAWAEEFGIVLDNAPGTYIPQLDRVYEAYPMLKKMVEEKVLSLNKEIILVQFCGGQSPLGDMKQAYHMVDSTAEPIKRNYYKGQELINEIHNQNPDAEIIHYALPNEPSYDNTVKIEMPYLAYHEVAKIAKAVYCIDSSLQHLATGACPNITVIWGETRPEHFGYTCNNNVCAKNIFNVQPYFKPLGISPSRVKMPSVKEVLGE